MHTQSIDPPSELAGSGSGEASSIEEAAEKTDNHTQ